MSKRVLLTGGAGFIGSHVADMYLARGYEVTVLDDLSTGIRENVPSGAEFVKGGVNDPESVKHCALQEIDPARGGQGTAVEFHLGKRREPDFVAARQFFARPKGNRLFGS